MSKLPRGMAYGILMAMAAQGLMSGHGGEMLPTLPTMEPRPDGYGVHLTKAQRRGKSWLEMQAMRAGKATP